MTGISLVWVFIMDLVVPAFLFIIFVIATRWIENNFLDKADNDMLSYLLYLVAFALFSIVTASIKILT